MDRYYDMFVSINEIAEIIETNEYSNEYELENRIRELAVARGFDASILPVDLVFLRASLNNESDRGCILMAASYLDNKLKQLLNGFFIMDENICKKALENNGFLSEMNSRIILAYVLGLISEKEYNDLNIIRQIRNKYAAHGATPMSFSDEAIQSRCKSLYHDFFPNEGNVRNKFIRVVIALISRIDAVINCMVRRHKKDSFSFDS